MAPSGEKMLTTIKSILLIVAINVLLAFSVHAQEPPVQECDRLAAHFSDKNAVAKGVSWDDINGEKAVVACAQAVKEFPLTLRFKYQYGRSLNKLSRFGEAAKWHRQAAEKGYASAQYSLGLMYSDGEGVSQDDKEKVKWITKSAEQGFAAAQYNLAAIYYNAEGVTQDYGKALEWFRKSAEQGDADSQLNLGLMYRKAKGVPQNHAEAFVWLKKSAEQGIADAQYNLGVIYYNGEGVTADFAEAIVWFGKAAEQEHYEALNSLAWLRATAKDRGLRNGADAVRFAKQALKLHEEDGYHDTLAAAYVENGQPDEAFAKYMYVMKLGGKPMIKTFQGFLRSSGYYDGIVTGRNDAATQKALTECVNAGCQIGVE